jgi:NADH:ubiquinone oxidoreductase subunit F (NADH-binding)
MIKSDTIKTLALTPQFPDLKKLVPFCATDDVDVIEVISAYIDACQVKVCGRCSPCRIGMIRIQTLLHHMVRKDAIEGDLERMIELASYVEEASLCPLGKGFTTPVLTCYKLFPDEFKGRTANLGSIA